MKRALQFAPTQTPKYQYPTEYMLNVNVMFVWGNERETNGKYFV